MLIDYIYIYVTGVKRCLLNLLCEAIILGFLKALILTGVWIGTITSPQDKKNKVFFREGILNLFSACRQLNHDDVF